MTGHRSLDIAIVIAIILASWIALFFVIAQVTGWASLAARFPARPPLSDAKKGLCSITFGAIGNYNNCILWASDEEGLSLRMFPLFASFHAPITIPWGEVLELTRIERGLRKGWITLHIGPTRLTVPGKLALSEYELRQRLAQLEPDTSEDPIE